MWPGVVPQQPPTMLSPYWLTKSETFSAKGSLCSGNTVLPSTSSGSPALGSRLMARGQCLARYCTCSAISVGPVAQFMPRLRMGKSRRAATTPAMSVPTKVVPNCSMVTCTMIGMSPVPSVSGVSPRSASTSRMAVMAHLTCKMSWAVSSSSTSAPPSSRPRTWAA